MDGIEKQKFKCQSRKGGDDWGRGCGCGWEGRRMRKSNEERERREEGPPAVGN